MEIESDIGTGRPMSDDDGEAEEVDNANKDEDNQDKKDAKKLRTKKTGPVRRLLLNEDMLCGKNGLIKLQDIFCGFQFKGRKHEKADLDRMLHKFEHWMHVMHPRYPFDQTLERIEFLGVKKKLVKTHVKKIRQGLITSEDAIQEDQITELEFEGGPSDDEMASENVPKEVSINMIGNHTPNNADEFPDEEDFRVMNNPSPSNADQFPDEEDFLAMNNPTLQNHADNTNTDIADEFPDDDDDMLMINI